MWFAGPIRRVPEVGRGGALRLGVHLEPGMRVGVYGGSFDPPHEGHLHVARTALARLGLDRVIWLVSTRNPLKTQNDPAELPARMAATRRLARGPFMRVSDLEKRIGARFTLDTLRVLKARHPAVHFIWIMGADNLAGFHHWRGWADIFREIPIAVVARPGVAPNAAFSPAARRFAAARLPSPGAARLATAAPPAWVFLAAPLKDISSTALRAGIKNTR
jgi:nicotinate-nucleotide adenylyltransferase